MPLTEGDYEALRAERDAEPERYQSWDPNRQYRSEYEALHARDVPPNLPGNTPIDPNIKEKEEELPPRPENEIERLPTTTSTTTTSSLPASTTQSQFQAVRSRPSARTRDSSGTYSYRHDPELHRSETHRVNGHLERHPTALDRINTHRSQHFGTVGSSARKEKQLPKFGGGKPYPPALPDKEEYVVEFDGHDDPTHAQNWSSRKKIGISLIAIWCSLSATFGSSIFAAGAVGVEAEFNVGSEVGTLGTSLFVLGYAFGPIIWAPMSELYGRRPPIVISSFGFGVFTIAVATAANIQTIMICRFFSGLFGSCPLAVVAAIFADIYSNETRGVAVACFSATVFMGPLLAPFVGGFIETSYLGWRWTMYISSFMGFSAFTLALLFLKETYPPLILVNKAADLRRATKNWGIHAKQEETEVDIRELVVKNVGRPLRILFTEPIVLAISIYMSFVYGLLYTFLTAYALIFQGVYGMNAGIGGLTYFGLVAGEILAFTLVVLTNPSYVRKLKANNNIPVPEWRLPIVMLGAPIFAAGIFWLGWTGYTGRIHWIVPTLSGVFTGFGLFAIFLQLLNYIIDAYLMFAASAIAGNTFLRSLFGAGFPLFARYMYEGVGIEWGQTLVGCVAVLLVPLPVLFWWFGKRIRGRSTFAPAPDIEQDKRRDEESSGQSVGSDERVAEPKPEDN